MKLKINTAALEAAIRQSIAGMRARPYICRETLGLAEKAGFQVHVVVVSDEDDFLDEITGEFLLPEQPAVPLRIQELAERLVAAGPKCCAISASECHEISDFIREIADVTEAPSGR